MKKLFLALSFFVVLFIWVNSLMSSNLSFSISNTVVKMLGGTVTHSNEEIAQTTTLFNSANVRKLAHFLEYAVFGCVAMILKLKHQRRLADILLLGLGIAVIDETIQLFDGRTSMIKDIWIDMAGFLFALLIVWIINQTIYWIHVRRGIH